MRRIIMSFQNKIESLDYRQKLILAPMVRISILPTRLLALDYGADLVYCEEIVDYKMLQCKRVENDLLGTVDFVWKDGTVVFRTCPRETNKVIFQIGTSDADRALRVARMVEGDVAGIDVNMGCPKEFSIKGGMGAALMTQPEKVVHILKTLVNGLSKPVTCKIRILPTLEETLHLVRLIEGTGVSAIAIHGRLREERPNHANHNDVIRAVAKSVNVPVIANGGSSRIKCHEDIERFRLETGATSVMIARAAQWNPSIFSRDRTLAPRDDVVRNYLKYSVQFDTPLASTKYCIQQILHEELDVPRGRMLLSSTSVRDICTIWGLSEYYDDTTSSREAKRHDLGPISPPQFHACIQPDGTAILKMDCKYNRRQFNSISSPKLTLHQWATKNKFEIPKYEAECHPTDRMFRSVLTFEGQKYASNCWDKSKKYSEQASAIVCIRILQMQRKNAAADLPEIPYVTPADDAQDRAIKKHCAAKSSSKDDDDKRLKKDHFSDEEKKCNLDETDGSGVIHVKI